MLNWGKNERKKEFENSSTSDRDISCMYPRAIVLPSREVQLVPGLTLNTHKRTPARTSTQTDTHTKLSHRMWLCTQPHDHPPEPITSNCMRCSFSTISVTDHIDFAWSGGPTVATPVVSHTQLPNKLESLSVVETDTVGGRDGMRCGIIFQT